MSAFTPYKKTGDESPTDLSVKKVEFANCLPKFSVDLTSVLFNFPHFPKSFYGLNSFPAARRVGDEHVEKSEKFHIKNILKNEESVERQRTEKKRMDFEEQASKMETIVSNLGKSDNGHKCIYCGKVYSRKYGLKIHIRTHTGYKPLKCKYCLRPFGDPSNLNKHVRLHARGHTSYNCQFCGKVLVRRRDLERHVKSKHGELS